MLGPESTEFRCTLIIDWPFMFTSHPRNHPCIHLVFLPLAQVVERISESSMYINQRAKADIIHAHLQLREVPLECAGIRKEIEVSIPRMSSRGLRNRAGYWRVHIAQSEKASCVGNVALL